MGGQQQGGMAGLLLPILLFIGIFYFLILRPQKKKQQQHEKMLSAISRGDTIVTAGGFFGKVSDILEDSYIIELADGVKVRILKSSISIRRDTSEGAPRTPRPKKKDRYKRREREASNSERTQESPEAAESAESNEVTAASKEEGVTTEEASALLDKTTDAAPLDSPAETKN